MAICDSFSHCFYGIKLLVNIILSVLHVQKPTKKNRCKNQTQFDTYTSVHDLNNNISHFFAADSHTNNSCLYGIYLHNLLFIVSRVYQLAITNVFQKNKKRMPLLMKGKPKMRRKAPRIKYSN